MNGYDFMMKCLEIKDKKLQLANRPIPSPKADEILIRVKAAGINRPDILQRLGHYPPPEGITDIAGLEVSGLVEQGNAAWPEGTPVCALLAGGGYAEFAVAPAGQILPSAELRFQESAALPETIFTVWANLGQAFLHRPRGTHLLVHGGSSGIGTAAIQMAKLFEWHISTTVGNAEKKAYCHALGADTVVLYKEQDFESVIETPVDYVLDMVGGDYVGRNLQIMNFGGTHISIAMLAGRLAEIDIRTIMQKQLVLTGSTLRARPVAEKTRLRDEILEHIWPAVLNGTIKAQIHAEFPLSHGQKAHEAMEKGDHCGKFVLNIDET